MAVTTFQTLSNGQIWATSTYTASLNGFGYETYSNTYLVSGGSAPSTPAAVATSTGVNPTETSYSLYGHPIPLSVFGVGRIGGEIIAGPWVSNGLASFCISFGVPADPTGTRDLREIAFDSEVVWTASGGFTTETFTYRFYGGTLTQVADPLEITNFGTNAVAYRPQILIWFENLPLAGTKFGKIPYVAAVIGDATGDDVNLGEAFERLAASPWVNFPDFETSGVTDGLVGGGLIIAQDYEFLQLIQQFGRFYPKWDILQTDKLRIVDRGDNVSADIELDRSRLMDKVAITRAEPNTVPVVLELSTIDPDADYTIVPSRAQAPRVPVSVTTSVKTDSVYLPAILDSSTRAATVTYARYHEEQSRKKISGTAMIYGLEIEPGDLVGIFDLGAEFRDEIYKVIETLHGANYSVEFTAELILRCVFTDDHISNVVLLLSFNGPDGSTTFTDESPRLHGDATVYADAQVDTSQSKFGSGAGYFDGTGDTLTFGTNTDWQLAAQHFTIECWIRPASVTGTQFIVARWGILGLRGFVLYLSGSQLAWNVSTTGGDNLNDLIGGTAVINTWTAVCVDFDGTTYRLYQDGVMVASSTTLRTIYTSAVTLSIGASQAPASSSPYNGWMDELRITLGVARYASNGGYTVPTSAFPRD